MSISTLAFPDSALPESDAPGLATPERTTITLCSITLVMEVGSPLLTSVSRRVIGHAALPPIITREAVAGGAVLQNQLVAAA